MKSKEGNVWNVKSIYEFYFFNCPSCPYRNECKEDFVNHSFTSHPESVNYLKKISDGSLNDITSPWESFGEEITEKFKNEINENLEDNWGIADNVQIADPLKDECDDMFDMKVESFPSEDFEESLENSNSSGGKIRSYSHNNIGYGTSKTAANKRRCGKEFF